MVKTLTSVIITNVKSVWRDYPSIRASQSTLVNTQRGVTPLSATLMAVTELGDPYTNVAVPTIICCLLLEKDRYSC